MNRSRTAAALLTAAAALTLAGCSSGSTPDVASATAAPPATGPDTAPEATGTAAAPGTATPTADHPASDSTACTATELTLTAGQSEGAAGSVMIPLVFTNTGGRTCTLDGFPGVSYVATKGGAEVGAAATRSGSSGGPVHLAPGAKATATVRAVQVLNYPSQQCVPAAVDGLQVFPPNGFDPLFLPRTGTGCSQTGVNQLEVTAVSASMG